MQMPPSIRSEEKYLSRLIEINSRERIPTEWLDTPIEAFIMSQNFGWPIQTTGNPELLISTCMEFRYALPMPRMYAYVIRRASGRVIGSEFSVGYTLAKGLELADHAVFDQLGLVSGHTLKHLAAAGAALWLLAARRISCGSPR